MADDNEAGMTIPKLSPVQLSVLNVLIDGEQSGRDLRHLLAKLGQRKGMASFYHLMSLLEDNELVRGYYRQKVVAGSKVRERRYQLTEKAKALCDKP